MGWEKLQTHVSFDGKPKHTASEIVKLELKL